MQSWICLILSLCTCSVLAQESSVEDTLFFTGKLDGLHPMDIELRWVHTQCEGHVRYLSSNLQFELKGNWEENQLMVEEKDKRGHTAGQFSLKWNGPDLQGWWHNATETLGLPTYWQAKPHAYAPVPEGKGEGWYALYQGIAFGEEVVLCLQRLQNTQFRGRIWFQRWNRSFRLNQMPTASGLTFVMHDAEGLVKGRLSTSSLKPEAKVRMVCTDLTDTRTILNFQLQEHWEANTQAYLGYEENYDLWYPSFHYPALQQHLDTLASRWVSQCTRKIQQRESPHLPENRGINRESAWFELVHASPVWISGFWHFSQSNPPRQWRLPMNFYLYGGRPLLPENLFQTGKRVDKLLQKESQKAVRSLNAYKQDDHFKDWIKTAPFPHLCLVREGLLMSSNFHPVYGYVEVLIPYEKLEKHLQMPKKLDYLLLRR